MGTVVRTVKVKDENLPYAVPQKMRRGDTFRGSIVRLPDGSGGYVDTSALTKVCTIYESNDCGAAVVATLDVTDEAGPEYGYRPVATPAESAAVPCGTYYYEIETDDGATVKTYTGGVFIVTGAGD